MYLLDSIVDENINLIGEKDEFIHEVTEAGQKPLLLNQGKIIF